MDEPRRTTPMARVATVVAVVALLAASVFVGSVPFAPTAAALGPGPVEPGPGPVIVVPAEGADTADLVDAARDEGAAVLATPAGTAVVDAEAAELADLAARPDVAAVVPSEVLSPLATALPSSTPAVPTGAHGEIGLPARWDEWPDAGAGRTVAVLDTGVDTSHPALAGKVAGRACFSTSATTGQGTWRSLCDPAAPGGGVGEACSLVGVDACAHGTAVAGAAVGALGTHGGLRVGGTAPGARFATVQVFSHLEGTGSLGAFTHDVLAALDWAWVNRGAMDLAAVNLSLGGTPGSAACTNDVGGTAIRRLRDAGVAVVVATGNDGATAAVSWPACIDGTVAVAATEWAHTDAAWGGQVVAGFSNIGPTTTLAAPGRQVVAPGPGSDGYALWTGTSLAAPLVAGAYAAWRQHHPGTGSTGTGSVGSFVAAAGTRTAVDARTGTTHAAFGTEALHLPPPATPAPATPRTPVAPAPAVPSPAAPAPAVPVARVEVLRGGLRTVDVGGWALQQGGGSPLVRVRVDGAVVATVPASRPRLDVWGFFGGTVSDKSGWSVTAGAAPGARRVCVDLQNSAGGVWHTSSCADVRVK